MTSKHLEIHSDQDVASADTVRDLPELNHRNHAEPTQFNRLTRLHRARRETDALFELISADAIYDRPIPERHRLIFYLGHFEAFDWNQVCRFELGMPSFHATFDKLFEAGIDPEVGRGPQDQPHDWPRVDEVRSYIAATRERVDAALEHASDRMFRTILEHRLMHAETFAYLLHEMSYDRKHGQGDGSLECPPASQEFIEIGDGIATLGQEQGAFGWDNEFQRNTVQVPRFRLSRHKVTNGEYLEFVRQGAPAPHFWAYREGNWFWRGMFDLTPLNLDSPVYVTHDEASAYAKAKGAKLPTEAQFHRAAYSGGEPAVSRNLNFAYWDPIPVTADAGTQLIGNGWEWTSTPFGPFEGFQAFPNYPGYSKPFFDGQHFVIKGASPRTSSEFLRESFRNWFRHDYPYVYSTFRLVQD